MIPFVTAWFGRAQPRLAPAAPQDAVAMAALHAKAFQRGWGENEFERLLAEPNILADRATVGRDLIAFSLSRLAADEAEILSIAVAPAWRRRGLAARLLELHLRRLAGRGVARLFLEVDESNIAARRLYARVHFRDVGRRPAYYAGAASQPASAALTMRRDLA